MIDSLYSVRGAVEFVDVSELGPLVIEAGDDPEGEALHGAMQALCSVHYGAHFAPKKGTTTLRSEVGAGSQASPSAGIRRQMPCS